MELRGNNGGHPRPPDSPAQRPEHSCRTVRDHTRL